MSGEVNNSINTTVVQKCSHSHFLHPFCKDPSYTTGKKVATIALLILLNVVTLGVPLIIYGIYKAGSYLYNACTKKDNTGAIRNQITSQEVKKLEADVKAALAENDLTKAIEFLPNPLTPSPKYDPILKLLIEKLAAGAKADPEMARENQEDIVTLAKNLYDTKAKENYLNQSIDFFIEKNLIEKAIVVAKNLPKGQEKDAILESIMNNQSISEPYKLDAINGLTDSKRDSEIKKFIKECKFLINAIDALHILPSSSETNSLILETLNSDRFKHSCNNEDLLSIIIKISDTDSEKKDIELLSFIKKINNDYSLDLKITMEAANAISDHVKKKDELEKIITQATAQRVGNYDNRAVIAGIKNISCSEAERTEYYKLAIEGYISSKLFRYAASFLEYLTDDNLQDTYFQQMIDEAQDDAAKNKGKANFHQLVRILTENDVLKKGIITDEKKEKYLQAIADKALACKFYDAATDAANQLSDAPKKAELLARIEKEETSQPE